MKTLSWTLGSDALEAKTTAVPESGAITHTLTADFDGKIVFKSESTVAADKSVHTVAHYYKPLSAIDVDVVFDVRDGIVRGTIAGKALAPIDMESAKKNPSSIVPRYADGATVVPLTTPAGDARLAALVGQMSAGSKGASCDPSGPDLKPMSEPGHVSAPGSSDECKTCKRLCLVQYIACLVGGSVGCLGCFGLTSIPFVGTGLAAACYAICEAIVSAGCSAAYATCQTGCNGACCPVKCGARCCNSGESCLSATAGTCCSEGLSPCPGRTPSCTDPATETCLPSGRSCSKDLVCGRKCCPANTSGGLEIPFTCVVETVNLETCCPNDKPFLCQPLDPVSSADVGVCCPQRSLCVRGRCMADSAPPVPAIP